MTPGRPSIFLLVKNRHDLLICGQNLHKFPFNFLLFSSLQSAVFEQTNSDIFFFFQTDATFFCHTTKQNMSNTTQQRKAKPTVEISPNTKQKNRAEDYQAEIKEKGRKAREAARRRTSPSPPNSPIMPRSPASSPSVSPRHLFDDNDSESDEGEHDSQEPHMPLGEMDLESGDGGQGDQSPHESPRTSPRTSPQRPTDESKPDTIEEPHGGELEHSPSPRSLLSIYYKEPRT